MNWVAIGQATRHYDDAQGHHDVEGFSVKFRCEGDTFFVVKDALKASIPRFGLTYHAERKFWFVIKMFEPELREWALDSFDIVSWDDERLEKKPVVVEEPKPVIKRRRFDLDEYVKEPSRGPAVADFE